MEKEIFSFIEKHTHKIKPLFKNMNLSFWDASVTGSDQDFQKYAEVLSEIQKIYNNKEDFEKIKNWRNIAINDSILKRQIEILYLSYLSAQGDFNLIKEIIDKASVLEQRFNNYRAKVKEIEMTDNQILKILEDEKDSEKLNLVWEASKRQGELVEKDVLEIIRLRNKLAKENGFDNYYIMSLKTAEQSQEELVEIFENLEKLTDVEFKKLKFEIDSYLSKKYNIKLNDLKPWHYGDLFFQEGPQIYNVNLDNYYQTDVLKIAKKFYLNIGLSVDNILSRSDLYEKNGKSQHAFCLDVDREGDVRILENLEDNEKWMETTLHELGHGVYQENIDTKLPFLLRDIPHILVTEAIAMLFGRLSKDISFIKDNLNQSISNEDIVSVEISKMLRLKQLVFVRWAMVMVNFERELYKNPEQDLNSLWWSYVKKYQLVDFSRNKPDWASKIHLISSPVYYHNYVFGELFASQLHNYIIKHILNQDFLEKVSYSGNKEIGAFLKNGLFKYGNLYRWDELIEKVTGEKLNPIYFVKQFINENLKN